MDAPLERDIKLQKASADLLSDLRHSLPGFLRKPAIASADSGHPGAVRSSVRERETLRLINLLEPFQEWPQLLDPHLSSLLPLLDSAFVEIIGRGGAKAWSVPASGALRGGQPVIPLHQAICKLIYVFCKIRGEKVISHFLNNEPRYLEPLLLAFETGEAESGPGENPWDPLKDRLVWEERYVMLLWLSQLLLAPFDLASMSSLEPNEDDGDVEKTLALPANLPGITNRLIALCLRYLAVASKERQSATALLVRLVLRPDMQKLGLLRCLLDWALTNLMDEHTSSSQSTSIFLHIGMLSFISGILVSANPRDISSFIIPIFNMAREIIKMRSTIHQTICSSAIARKLLIKIYRSLTLIAVQNEALGFPAEASSAILEDVIEYLLTVMADKDTPVRYAASKALSMITAKLDDEMAAEVVEAVAGSLAEDVLYEDEATGRQMAPAEVKTSGHTPAKRNLTAVNPLRWHGLTLTLAHLLFRRSPPPHQLPEILNSLLLSLEFEQRSPTGSSIGTNVRDAACFGIWALSRRYTTKELLQIDTSSIPAANRHGGSVKVPQVLATELVVAASIDLAGNIRRGASAALQELIGRHPDTIIEGISVVQVLDYHAVALRSRAITDVAMRASQLSGIYWNALFDAMLGWRGVGAVDATARRTAAEGIGTLCLSSVELKAPMNEMLARIVAAIQRLGPRQVEEKHGLLLSISAILEITSSRKPDAVVGSTGTILDKIYSSISSVSAKNLKSSVLRPELTAEATCALIASAMALPSSHHPQQTRLEVFHSLTRKSVELVTLCLTRTEPGVIEAASTAARQLVIVLDSSERDDLIQSWVRRVVAECQGETGISGRNLGYLAALGTVFSDLGADAPTDLSTLQQTLVDALVLCAKSGADMESRVAAMNSLTTGVISHKVLTTSISQVLSSSLDDYTIDSRGDVGSWIRLAAIDAVSMALDRSLLLQTLPTISPSDAALISRVARLSAEKLDKVRTRAWLCLSKALVPLPRAPNPDLDLTLTSSSTTYFSSLLALLPLPYPFLRTQLLTGYVTSSGVGSESILVASRTALSTFLPTLPSTLSSSATTTTDEEEFTIWAFISALKSIISTNLTNDRVLIPALETLAFLLEADLLPTSPSSSPSSSVSRETDSTWRSIFNLTQKAHYKSTNVQKLDAAVKVYAGLLGVPSLSDDVVKRLRGMLVHPFPKIRDSAAETLFALTLGPSALGEESYAVLKRQDWGASPRELKAKVEKVAAVRVATA